MNRQRVVVTGAAGYLAQRMHEALAAAHDLVLLDVRTEYRDGRPGPGVIPCDLTQADREPLRAHFRGADAVIHLSIADIRGLSRAARRENSPENFGSVLDNLRMAYNVYQTAMDEGVRRVIVASSVHATDYHMDLVRDGLLDFSTPEMRPATREFYGWGKICSEHLGHIYAVGKGGPRKLELILLRIGATADDFLDGIAPGDAGELRQKAGVWLSARDQQQLFLRCLDAADISDRHGDPFRIFYGISNNTHRYFPLAEARRVIGYAPQDDAAVMFAERIARLSAPAPEAT